MASIGSRLSERDLWCSPLRAAAKRIKLWVSSIYQDAVTWKEYVSVVIVLAFSLMGMCRELTPNFGRSTPNVVLGDNCEVSVIQVITLYLLRPYWLLALPIPPTTDAW